MQRVGNITEAKKKFFFGPENCIRCGGTTNPIWKNHCMHEKGQFPKYYSSSGENSGDSVYRGVHLIQIL